MRAVRADRLLPEPFVRPVSCGLPVVELALGLTLLVGLAVRLTAVVSAVLLVVFAVAVVSAWGPRSADRLRLLRRGR